MYRILGLAVILICPFALGCEGTSGPANVAEDADAAAIAEYKAMIAKEEQQYAAGSELTEAAVGPIKESL